MTHAASETTKIAVSVVIPTLNESARIGDAVRRLAWADEVIVVDGGSTDDTAHVARSAGASVLALTGRTIGAQRNAGAEAARNRWIFALDADETISDALRGDIARVVASTSTPYTVYRVPSRNWHLGREIRHAWGRDWKLRLYTRDHRFTEVRVHENIERPGDVGTLESALLHYPYRDLAHHVAKASTYARWGAEELHARGRHASMFDVVLRPPARFIRDYIIIGAWRDGRAGFMVAAVSAFQVFVKYGTLLTLESDHPGSPG